MNLLASLSSLPPAIIFPCSPLSCSLFSFHFSLIYEIHKYKQVGYKSEFPRLSGLVIRMSGLYKVERIVGKKMRDAKNIEYKVKWQGYPSSQNTWEPLKNLRNVQNLVDEFEDRNRDRLPSLPLKKEITNGKPAPPTQAMDVEETTPMIGIKVEQRKRPLQKEGEKRPRQQEGEKEGQKEEKNNKEREDNEDEMRKGKSNHTMQTENEDYQDIDMQKDSLNGPLEAEADFLENGNLEKIAQRIVGTIEMRKKTTRIVDVFRMQPEAPLTYVTNDASGNQEEHSREYMMRNFPTELLDFYEQHIGTVGSRLTE